MTKITLNQWVRARERPPNLKVEIPLFFKNFYYILLAQNNNLSTYPVALKFIFFTKTQKFVITKKEQNFALFSVLF